MAQHSIYMKGEESMKKFTIKEKKGVFIGEGMTRREVKLFSSPNSPVQSEHFALGMTIVEPGQEHEIHEHDCNQEIVVVYSGEGRVRNGEDNVHAIKKGDILCFGFNDPHGFINDGNEDLMLLWIYYPPGLAESKFLTTEE